MTDKSGRPAGVEAAAVFGPWGQMGAAWAEAMGELGSEVLHFVSERVRADVETQTRLLHARTPEEVRHIQAQFVQTAIDQYTAETGRLVDLGGEMAARLGLPKAV